MKRRCFSFNSIVVFLFSCLLIVTACQREISDETGSGGGGTTPGVTVDDNIMVTAGVRGIVVDQNNLPVQGAIVTSGSGTTTTDRYGVFNFKNISLSKANGYVKVVKAGYFLGAKTFVTTAGRIHNVRIQLIPKTNTGTFDASTGGTVSLASGGKVVLPAGAMTDAGGIAYSGMVNVAMTWINPTAANLPEIVPGDLRGITTSGEERGLQTFGMLGVELTTTGGQPLKITAGKKAELTFPIPAALGASAPATIDLWHFDEAKGRWIQEGTATKTGSNYVAQVSHFSFWNCDAPFPLIDLCMTVVNAANNQPLVNVQVRIKRPNGSYGYGWTDSLGNLCGKVPKNEALTLQVMDMCNSVAYSQNIGPFSSNTSLGTISTTLPASSTLIITGTLTNCSNANVTNGSVVVYTNNANSFTAAVTNGTFTVTLIHCGGAAGVNFAITGYDVSASQQSAMVNGTGVSGTVNVGTIQACGAPDEYIEYIVDGVPVNWFDLGSPNTITLHDSSATSGSYTNTAGLYGQWVVNNNAETTYFWFSHNATTGSYPLSTVTGNVKINDHPGTLLLKEFVSATPTVNITTYGPAGGYVEGNFTEQMKWGASPIVNVVCHFRVKR